MIGVIKNIAGIKKLQNYGTFGTVFNDNYFSTYFLTSLGYTQNGLNAVWTGSTISPFVLNISNSVNGLDDFIQKNVSLGSLDSYTLRAEYIVTTIDSDSDGIGVGFYHEHSFQTYFYTCALLTDSTNLGKLAIWTTGDTYGSPSYISSGSINVSANDELAIQVVRDGKNQNFVITAYNITQDESISYEASTLYPSEISDTTGYFCLYSLGGDCKVSLFYQTSEEVTNADYCIIGDSISNRIAASAVGNSFNDILEANITGEWVTYSGGGDTTDEVLGNFNQITKLNPANVILNIGSNDFALTGKTYNEIRDDHQSIVSQLEALGINVIICELIPRNGQNFTIWNNQLRIWYPGRKIISLYDELGGNIPNATYYIADLTHLNDTGMAYIASLIESQL